MERNSTEEKRGAFHDVRGSVYSGKQGLDRAQFEILRGPRP